jgi:hypothetical protein
MVIAAGSALCLGQLLADQPDRDDAQAADQVAEDLLRMFGVPATEAHEICQRPLPDPGVTPPHNPASDHPEEPHLPSMVAQVAAGGTLTGHCHHGRLAQNEFLNAPRCLWLPGPDRVFREGCA